MKKKLRDLLIAAFYYSGIVFVYQRLQRRHGPLVRVVCFHDVRDGEWFEDMVAMIVKNYHVLSVSDFEQGKLHNKKINILFTFDDGYQSWVDVVLPVFQKYNIQGIFFVCSGLLDVASTENEQQFVQHNLLLKTERKLLTWDGVETLHRAGQVVGGHTVNHQRLTTLTPQEVEREVVEDKEKLESVLKTKLIHFAYPFGTVGDCSEVTNKIVQAAGYDYIHTAMPGWCNAGDFIRVKRLLLEERQSLFMANLWMAGGYDLCRFVSK